MLNKTIVATICLTTVLIALILVKSDPFLIWSCLSLIAALNGLSLYKANHTPKQ